MMVDSVSVSLMKNNAILAELGSVNIAQNFTWPEEGGKFQNSSVFLVGSYAEFSGLKFG